MEQAQELDVVQKPTATVHVAGGYTLAQRKLANICFACGQQDGYANNQDANQDHAYALPVSVVSQFMGHDQIKNHKWIKDILIALTTKEWEYNIFSIDQESWGVFTLLAGGEVSDGYMYFTFNPVFLKKMQGCQLNTNLSLQVQSGFKRKQSLPIYEYGKDLLSRNQSDTGDDTLSVKELQQFLGVKSSYPILKRDVLKPIHDELNQKSDLHFSYQGLNEGRSNKVTSVKLSFSAKEEFDAQHGLIEPEALLKSALQAPLQPATTQTSNANPDAHENLLLHKQLETMGVDAGQARKLVADYEAARILDNIKYVQAQAAKAQKPFKSYGGYMVKAIRDNYAPQTSEEERSSERRSQWRQHREKRAHEYFRQLPKRKQGALREQFLSSIKQSDEFSWQRYQYHGGWDSPAIKIAFFEHTLVALLKTPEETNFEAFCDWQQKQILPA